MVKEESAEKQPAEKKPVEKKKVSRAKDIPKKKLKEVEELANLIKDSASIIIVSIKNLPTSQFQLIKKKLRGQAVIKVVKKNLINLAIDNVEKGAIKNFKKHLKEDIALIFSKLEPFELSAILSKNKSMARAKVGQVVDNDVVVEPGPTELIPGPIVSELGSLGLQFAVEDGKISIKQGKTILKAGDTVNEASASIMNKLDMKPISVGLEPVLAYDAKEDVIYENIKVDAEAVIEDMRNAAGKAVAFAVKLAYACKDTIGYLLAKASSEEKALSGLSKEEKKSAEKPAEKKKEEIANEKTQGAGEGESEGKEQVKAEEKTSDVQETEENKPQEEK